MLVDSALVSNGARDRSCPEIFDDKWDKENPAQAKELSHDQQRWPTHFFIE